MSDALRALIARVESAAGADADLDRLISHHVVYAPQPEWHLRLSLRDKWTVPAYTASLDAALSLVSDGDGIELRRYWMATGDPYSSAEYGRVWSACITTGLGDQHASKDRPSGALALTVATLRARLAMEGNDE